MKIEDRLRDPKYLTVEQLYELRWSAAKEIEQLRLALQASESLKAGYIEGHNKLAERVGTLDAALRNFADPNNWYEAVGCQQWMGKRDARDLAETALQGPKPHKD